jgi:hypothetical protein
LAFKTASAVVTLASFVLFSSQLLGNVALIQMAVAQSNTGGDLPLQ